MYTEYSTSITLIVIRIYSSVSTKFNSFLYKKKDNNSDKKKVCFQLFNRLEKIFSF